MWLLPTIHSYKSSSECELKKIQDSIYSSQQKPRPVINNTRRDLSLIMMIAK